MEKAVLSFFILIFFYSYTYAQVERRTVLKGVVVDSVTRTPVEGVVVFIKGEKDTLAFVTGKAGRFVFEKLYREMTYKISLHHLSYTPKIYVASLDSDTLNLGVIPLSYKEVNLEDVIVRGKIPLMAMAGDTTLYNAAAVKVLEGSEAIELIKKLPGIEVSGDDYVYFGGKLIEETRVDYKLIFGTDQRDALRNLLADDVVQVQIYDVQTLGKQGKRKKKIMNLMTKSKLEWQRGAHAIVSYGADMDRSGQKGRSRYGIGAELNNFAETDIIKGNYLFSNFRLRSPRINHILTNRITEGYNRNNGAQFSYEKRKKQLEMILDYQFQDDFTKSVAEQSRDYFPSDGEHLFRTFSQKSTSDIYNQNHSVGVKINNENQFRSYGGSVRFNYEKNSNSSTNDSRVTIDNVVSNHLQSTNKLGGNKYSVEAIGGAAFWSSTTSRVISFDVGINLGKRWNDEIRIDSLQTTTVKTVLNIDNSEPYKNANLGLNYENKFLDAFTIRAGYELKYMNNKSRKITVDNDLVMNHALSYDYTMNYWINKGTLSVNYFGVVNTTLGLGLENATQNRDEEVPYVYRQKKRFTSILPQATFQYYTDDHLMSVTMRYSSATILPSDEMVRPYIDSRNQMMLNAGNPELKHSISHSVEIEGTYKWPDSGILMLLSASGKAIQREITSMEYHFARDTILNDYMGYQAVKGSTLRTYVNGEGSKTMDLSLNASFKATGITFRIIPSYAYADNPFYLKDELVRVRRSIPTIKIGATSAFSRKVDFSLNFSSSYGRQKNTLGEKDNFFNHSGNMTLNLICTKRTFCNIKYYYSFYKYLDQNMASISSHLLNGVIGINLLKDNKFSISLSAFDILDKSQSFRMAMESNYVERNKKETTGRLFTLNLNYRFVTSGKK